MKKFNFKNIICNAKKCCSLGKSKLQKFCGLIKEKAQRIYTKIKETPQKIYGKIKEKIKSYISKIKENQKKHYIKMKCKNNEEGNIELNIIISKKAHGNIEISFLDAISIINKYMKREKKQDSQIYLKIISSSKHQYKYKNNKFKLDITDKSRDILPQSETEQVLSLQWKENNIVLQQTDGNVIINMVNKLDKKVRSKALFNLYYYKTIKGKKEKYYYAINEKGLSYFTPDESKAEKLTTKNGKLEVKYLLLGHNYYFQEIEAPKGYQLNHKEIEFRIKSRQTSSINIKNKIICVKKEKQNKLRKDNPIINFFNKYDMKQKLFISGVCACTVVMIYSAVKIIKYETYRVNEDKVIETLQEKKKTSENSEQEEKTTDEKKILKEYEKLYNENNDMYGWLKIEDEGNKTLVNQPVMYTPNDYNYYEDRNWDKEKCKGPGTSIWIDGRSTSETENIIIYGHNMKDGTMFGKLREYKDEEYYQTHKYIQFDTLYEKQTYEIISVSKGKVYYTEKSTPKDEYIFYDHIELDTESDFNEYINNMKKNAYYNIDATAKYGDQLITLCTCDTRLVTNGRLLIIAKKIDNVNLNNTDVDGTN